MYSVGCYSFKIVSLSKFSLYSTIDFSVRFDFLPAFNAFVKNIIDLFWILFFLGNTDCQDQRFLQNVMIRLLSSFLICFIEVYVQRTQIQNYYIKIITALAFSFTAYFIFIVHLFILTISFTVVISASFKLWRKIILNVNVSCLKYHLPAFQANASIGCGS